MTTPIEVSPSAASTLLATTNFASQPQSVKFLPLNDNVLVKLDVYPHQSSIIQPHKKAKVAPSGTVLAVGRGSFLPGIGWQAPQVTVGDRVALALHATWENLPLSESSEDIYVAVPESVILGKLVGASPDSAWFKKPQDAEQGERQSIIRGAAGSPFANQ